MKRIEKGSFTVEAAFIMPIIIYTLFAILYLSFLLHDVCKVHSAVDRTLEEAILFMKHEVNPISKKIDYSKINDRGVFYFLRDNHKKEEEIISKSIQDILQEGFLVSELGNVDVKANRSSVSISVTIDRKVNFPGGGQWARKSKVIETKIETHNPSEFLRLANVIMKTGEGVQGIEESMNRVKDMIQKVR